MARKNRYKTKVLPYLDKVLQWKYDRISNKEICKRLGISEKSFYNYMKDNDEFKETIELGERHYTNIIENRLIDLCLGGIEKTRKEITTEGKDKDNKPIIKSTKIIKEETLPSINAIRYFLDRYKFKINLDEENNNKNGGVGVDISIGTDREQKEALSIRLDNIVGEMDKFAKE